MAIDDRLTPPLDSYDEELADEINGRVKSELEPGERLLWAAPPRAPSGRLSKGSIRALVIAAVLSFPTIVSWAKIVQNPLGDIGGLLFLGLLLGVVEFFIIFGLALAWNHKRTERARLAGTLYAITDRRAIIWMPESAGAVKIVTIPRGRVSGIHRVEYPDGSGDVLFNAQGDGQFRDDVYWPYSGFRGVADVRRVEEQVRRTLVLPPSGLNDTSVS